MLLCLIVCFAAVIFCLQSRYDGDYLGGLHTHLHITITFLLQNKQNKSLIKGLAHAFLLILMLVQIGMIVTHRFLFLHLLFS